MSTKHAQIETKDVSRVGGNLGGGRYRNQKGNARCAISCMMDMWVGVVCARPTNNENLPRIDVLAADDAGNTAALSSVPHSVLCRCGQGSSRQHSSSETTGPRPMGTLPMLATINSGEGAGCPKGSAAGKFGGHAGANGNDRSSVGGEARQCSSIGGQRRCGPGGGQDTPATDAHGRLHF